MSQIQSILQNLESQVNVELGVSNWIEIDQPLIDGFGKLTRDDQWIHSDVERAALESPFGGTIAHGFLTLSLASRFALDVIQPLPGEGMAVNYGFDKLRFLAPVPCGARVRGRFSLSGVRQKSDNSLLRTLKLVVEIKGSETPALIAEWLGMVVFDQT